MKIKFPFDPSLKHHIAIALGLAVWIFVFLYFTEPLDVHEFGDREKLLYLPFYGLTGALAYVITLPFQYIRFRRKNKTWSLLSEVLFFAVFIFVALIITRSVYLYIIVAGEPNPYPLRYYIMDLYLPAILTILPIVIAGRWAFGKYLQKKIEDKKIEIPGEGTYEGLRLLATDLIAVKADDNYIEVTYFSSGNPKKQLIRNRLSVVTEAIPELLQTHRSFSVNPFHFQQWKTENSKLHIILSAGMEVPVSKTYAAAVKDRIHSATK